MINDLKTDANQRMAKCISSLQNELSKLRTGRAHPGLLEHIMVPYYGTDTPISQVANIAVENARSLAVTPWEKNMVAVVEKAIRTSDLGLNPVTAGDVIRVPLPPLTEERRKDLVKVVRTEGEKSRVAIRNVRRDANNSLKELLKGKEIGEDEEHRAQTEMQKLTDKYVAEVDQLLTSKEADLLEI